jgi:Na+/pantothenate symporter
MIVGAFAALYSTVITLIDGSTRAASQILPMALGEEDAVDEERFRRGMIVVQALVAITLIAVLGLSPVTFIVWIAAALAVVEVFFYPANWYVVEKNLPEPFRPSRAWHVYYAGSLVLVIAFGLMGAAVRLGFI